MSGKKTATAEVKAIGEINFRGNTIPHYWYNHLTFKNGKPNLNAIVILSEIVYWYRPTSNKDEKTGQFKGWQNNGTRLESLSGFLI
jgi:hypothetical protein